MRGIGNGGRGRAKAVLAACAAVVLAAACGPGPEVEETASAGEAVHSSTDGGFPPPVHPATFDGPRDCDPVSGTFTNQFLTGATDCPDSPIFLCTRGELEGGLEGTYEFTFSTNEQVGQGSAPVVRFTGQSVVTTDDGTFTGQDFGILRTTQFPDADFTTHLRIQSGTGEFEGATGHLTIQGEASFLDGTGSGTYHGVVCVPREDGTVAAGGGRRAPPGPSSP